MKPISLLFLTVQSLVKSHPTCGLLTTPSNFLGGVYFMTNDPAGNSLVISALHTDASLTFSHTLPTAGLGGVPEGPISADPLNSQDSIIIGNGSLFVVNAGSNSFSRFAINPQNPLELTLKDTTDSGGDFPISMAYSESLKWLCILNSGARCGVLCFAVGDLAPLPQTNKPLTAHVSQTTPPSGDGTFSHVIFNQNDTQLLVSIKGDTARSFKGFVASFKVNSESLSLSEAIINYPEGSGFFSLTNIVGSDAVMFTDLRFGFGDMDFDGGVLKGSTLNPIPEQQASCWSVCSPLSRHCFSVDGKGVVTEVRFEGSPTKGEILGNYETPPFSVALDTRLVTVGDVEYLVILGPNMRPTNHGVIVMTVSGADVGATKYYFYNETTTQGCGVKLTATIQGMDVFLKRA